MCGVSRDRKALTCYLHAQVWRSYTASPSATLRGCLLCKERFLVATAILAPEGIYQLLTIAQASAYFDVTPAAIRKWDQLGKVQSRSTDGAGRKLYCLHDLALCEKASRLQSGREKRDQQKLKQAQRRGRTDPACQPATRP